MPKSENKHNLEKHSHGKSEDSKEHDRRRKRSRSPKSSSSSSSSSRSSSSSSSSSDDRRRKERREKRKHRKHEKEDRHEDRDEHKEKECKEKKECEEDEWRSECYSLDSPRSTCSSMKSDCYPEKCHDELYCYLKKRLLKDKSLMPFGSDVHGSFYSVGPQTVNVNDAVVFESNQDLLNMTHIPGSQNVYVRKSGIYFLTFTVDSDEACQFGIFVNNIAVSTSIAGKNAGAGQLLIHQVLVLNKDDIINARNHSSGIGPVDLAVNAGGNSPGTNAELVVIKIAPHPDECEYQPRGKPWCELSHKKKKLFKCIEEKMLCDKALMLDNSQAHGSFWSTLTQNVAVGASITFENAGNVKNLEWKAGTGNVKICHSGVYSMEFTIGTTKASQFTVFVNGLPVVSTTAGTNQGSGQLILRQTLSLNAGDLLSVVNYTSAAGTVAVSTNAGGLAVGIDASLVLYKLAPLACDLDPCAFVREKLECAPECEEWDEECHNKWKKLYNSYRRYLLHRRCLMVDGAQGYASFFRNTFQSLQAEKALNWPLNLNLHKIKHFQGGDEILICESGVYKFALNVETIQPAQFSIFVNGCVVPSTISGNDTGSNVVCLLQLLKLKKCDKITVVNHTSAQNPIDLQINPGGGEIGINAGFVLYKIAPLDYDK